MFRYYADLADKEPGRLVDAGRTDLISRVVYEPVGVWSLITPCKGQRPWIHVLRTPVREALT